MTVTIYTDGGARGNPGPAGIGGVVFSQEGEVLAEVSEYIGKETNNVAEYQALRETLKAAIALGATTVECFLDSQLVVKQMNREYKVKDQTLAQIFLEIHNLTAGLTKVTYTHVRREHNTHADALVNKAIDAAVKKH